MRREVLRHKQQTKRSCINFLLLLKLIIIYHKWLKTTQIYYSTSLEVRSPTDRKELKTTGMAPPGGSREEFLVLFSPPSRDRPHSLTCGLFHLQSASLQPLSASHEDPCDCICFQDNLSISRPLAEAYVPSPSWCVRYLQEWGSRISLWGHYSAHHRCDIGSMLLCKHIIWSLSQA